MSEPDDGKRKWVLRASATQAGVAAAIALSFAAGLAAALVFAIREAREADAAREVATSRALAGAALANSDHSPELAMLLALEAYSRVHDHDAGASYEARNSLLTTVQRAARLRSVLYGLPARAREIAFSPDGRTLAVAGEDGRIRFWNATTGRPAGTSIRAGPPMRFSLDSATLVASTDEGLTVFDVAERAPRGPAVGVVAFIDNDDDGVADQDEIDDTIVFLSSNARAAVAVGLHGVFTVWDLVHGAPLIDLVVSDPVRDGAWSLSPDNRFFAITEAGRVTVFDLLAGVALLRLPLRHVTNVEFGPDRKLAVATPAGIELWDVVTGAPAGDALRTDNGAIGLLAFSPDGEKLAFTGAGGRARIWEISRGPSRARLIRGVAGIHSLAFSPNGGVLAVGTDEGTTFVDAARKAPLIDPIEISAQDPSEDAEVAFSPDGRTVASAADDGTIRVWDIERRVPFERWRLRRIDPISGITISVGNLAFTTGGRRLVANGDDGVVVWALAPRPSLHEYLYADAASDLVRHMAVSPDGRMLAFTRDDATIRLLDLVRGRTIGELATAADSLAFSADGRTLATSSGLIELDGAEQTPGIKLWDVARTSQLGKPLPGGGDDIALSPDGQIVASGPLFGGQIRLWSVPRRTRLAQIASGAGVWELAFSPDGRTLAVASDDGGVRLWDVSRSPPMGGPALRGHTHIVEGVVFSPDGLTLASGDQDGTVRLWDITRGAPLGEALSSPTGSVVNDVAFSPDGGTLASADNDGIRVWASILVSRDLDTWRERICPTVRRNLTKAEWQRFLPDESYRETCPQFD